MLSVSNLLVGHPVMLGSCRALGFIAGSKFLSLLQDLRVFLRMLENRAFFFPPSEQSGLYPLKATAETQILSQLQGQKISTLNSLSVSGNCKKAEKWLCPYSII